MGYSPAITGVVDVGGDCRGSEADPAFGLRALIASQPEGSTFCLAPGVYRFSQPLVLKQGQKLIGTGGGKAVISGAKLVGAKAEGG